MFYLGIDQHARQITISLRDDSGDVLQARQGSARNAQRGVEKPVIIFAHVLDDHRRSENSRCKVGDRSKS